jgi:hypothetical protein
MRVGDLVKWNNKVVIIVELYESKCWRTDAFGIKVNWGQIPYERFARIIINGDLRGVPIVDLKPLAESARTRPPLDNSLT